MTWWFIVLGFSALVVVCVAIALFLRVRHHMSAGQPAPPEDPETTDPNRIGPA